MQTIDDTGQNALFATLIASGSRHSTSEDPKYLLGDATARLETVFLSFEFVLESNLHNILYNWSSVYVFDIFLCFTFLILLVNGYQEGNWQEQHKEIIT